ncbi:myb domain protein 16 [Striga asiatica]|uniref:Myb domain protein 16 n=1 Tax=Striga asiatica TaxID=4170 RepID=A0A5A7PDN7_STRAF|nr:myb domain protein 16 [Striga asiatica]
MDSRKREGKGVREEPLTAISVVLPKWVQQVITNYQNDDFTKKIINSKAVDPSSYPESLSLLSLMGLSEPLELLDRRQILRGRRSVEQLLVQWARFGLNSMSWEDSSFLHHNFPFSGRKIPSSNPCGQGSLDPGKL